MVNEQKIRGLLFYLSVAVFLAGILPILSFALGYKFDPRTFKFTKTGIISLKTQPEGASVYLDGRLLDARTPTTIGELLPGSHSLKIELKRYYPWLSQINVEPRKVVRLEKIILFPRRPHITQLNQEKVSFFWPDKGNNRIYYLGQEGNILYKSTLGGEKFEEILRLPENFSSSPMEIKLSPDREKMLVYNAHQVAVLYLNPPDGLTSSRPPVIWDYPKSPIRDVFWHSESYYLIVVTDVDIEALEIKARPVAVNLVSLNKKISNIFYDSDTDMLYFMDSQGAPDGVFYDNVYRLELNSKAYLLDNLMKMRKNAQE